MLKIIGLLHRVEVGAVVGIDSPTNIVDYPGDLLGAEPGRDQLGGTCRPEARVEGRRGALALSPGDV